jgi:putative transposase
VLLYVVLHRVLQLFGLLCRSTDFQELEILVLRHELAVLRRHVARPALRPADRLFLAAASRLLPRVRWSSFLVKPATLLGDRRFIARAVDKVGSELFTIVHNPEAGGELTH